MNTSWIYTEIVQLLGMLTAAQGGGASWWDLEVEVQRVIARLRDEEASELRDDLLDDLQCVAEHIQNRQTADAHQNLVDAIGRLA